MSRAGAGVCVSIWRSWAHAPWGRATEIRVLVLSLLRDGISSRLAAVQRSSFIRSHTPPLSVSDVHTPLYKQHSSLLIILLQCDLSSHIPMWRADVAHHCECVCVCVRSCNNLCKYSFASMKTGKIFQRGLGCLIFGLCAFIISSTPGEFSKTIFKWHTNDLIRLFPPNCTK